MTFLKKALPLAALLALALPVASASAAPKAKVQLSQAAYAAAENAGNATVTVVRPRNGHSTARLSQAVSVDYRTADGTARAGTDYTAVSGTLSFPACGSNPAASDSCLKQTVSIPVIDNYVADGARTLTFKLSNARTATRRALLGYPSAAAVVIADDDTSNVGSGSTFQVATALDYVSEASGIATAYVIRSGDLTSGAAVHYATSDSSAKAGVDYTAASGTLNFPAQSVNPVSSIIQAVPITLLHNVASSPQLNDFTLTLGIPSNTSGALSSPSAERVVIVNSDGPATVLWAEPAYNTSEAAGGASLLALAGGSITGNDEVTATYATKDGTAVAGLNYVAQTDTLEFFADDFAEQVDLSVLDDGAAGDKAFSVDLTGALIGSPGSTQVNVADSGVRTGPDPAAGGSGVTGTGGSGGTGTAGGNTGGDGQVVLGDRRGSCGLVAKVAKKQKLVKQKGLKLKLRTGAACKVTVTTKIKQLRSKSKKKPAEIVRALSFKGKKASLTLQPGKAKTVKVKFTKKTLKAIKKALRARKKLVATVVVTTRDSASKVSRKTLKITIKR